MPRKPRAQAFLFDIDRFRHDPNVLRMPTEAVGAYIFMLCNLWLAHDPGVVEADDITLSRTARCDSEEWARVKPWVQRCFDVTSRPGFWVQKGLVKTYRAQSRVIKRFKKRAKVASRTRWKGALQPNDTLEDACYKHPSSNAQAMHQAGGSRFLVLGSKTLGVGSVATEASLSGVDTRKSAGSLSAATQQKIQRLDTRLVSAGIGKNSRALVIDHFIANADNIRSPDAYYRPGSEAFDQLVRDLSAKFEINQHQEAQRGSQEAPRSASARSR